MKRILLQFIMLVFLGATCFGQQVTIFNKKFVINNNASCPIYFNGANTPWESWNDFGGTYSTTKWAQDMVDLKNKGINATRIWFSCNGSGQPSISTNGTVSAPSAAFWTNCDHLFAQAQANGVYVMATMMSFDHTKDGNPNANNWIAMMNDPTKTQTYIDNYLVPFVNRYKTNPYLWSIDICNEIEWIAENTDNWQCSYATLQRFVGMCASGLHQSGVARTDGTKVLITLGSASVKWNGTKLPNGSANPDGNKWSDANLKAQTSNDANAYLDFYSPHFYGWMEQYNSSPFEKTPTQFGMDDKACVVGEMPSRDPMPTPSMSLTTAFGNLKTGGWQGHMPWTSNITTNLSTEVGSLADFGAAALAFKTANTTLVVPNCTNQVPTVSLIAPTNNSSSCLGSAITLTATATDADGTISKVEFYDGTTLLGSSTTSPYSYSWTTAGSGTHSLTAKATDNGSAATTSTAITVTVNAIPSSTITPGGPTTFCSGGSVLLSANTGTGYTYVWKNGGTAIATATTSTYSATAAGSYTVDVTSNGCTKISTATTVTVNALPTATITPVGSTTFCTGGSVDLNANTGTGLTYVWKNGGTTIATATTSSYSATAAGSYTVVVTANGCTKTSTATAVTINTIPSSTITPGGPTTFCSGGSVLLSANTGTGYTYVWKNGGTTIATATTSTYSATAAGSYTVDVTSNGCTKTSTATTVTVNALPTATISPVGSTTFCTGGSVDLNANTGTGFTYVWKNGGITIATATTSSYSATAAGSYTVDVTANGCTKTSTATAVIINTIPTSTITPGGPTTFCNGGSVLLSANTGTGYTYIWKNGATTIATATTSTYSATTAGSYTVDVTSNGCTKTSTATTVTVNALPTATISPVGNTTFCTGGSVDLNANTGTGLTYVWKNGGTTITTATTSTYTATAAGSYTVDITSNGCTKTSNATTVTVNTFPTATITAAGSTTICTGSNVKLNANIGTGFTYVWKNGGTAIGAATTSSYTATAAGSYSVDITSNGCTKSSSSVNVTENPLPTTSITPVGSTTFCTGGSVVLNANTGTGYTYIWKNGATTIATATTSSYTASVSGSYTVTITSNSCSATSAATSVTVNALSTATITPVGSSTFCAGGSVVLNANTGTGFTYVWKNGGVSIPTATTSSYTATVSGTYTVEVTSNGCTATSTGIGVTVNAIPTATITPVGNTTFCTGGNVVLSANTGSGYTYVWKNGATTIATATTSSYTANAAGSYSVTITSNSCSATSSATSVVVNTIPTATIAAVGNTTFCTGGSVVLNANTGTGFTYVWKNGTTTIGTATSASYTASANGSYNVTVTVNGCFAVSTSTTVVVDALPTISAAGTDQNLTSTSGAMSANTPLIGSGTWSVVSGTGTFTNANNPTSTVNGLSQGSNTFRWTIINGTCTSSTDDIIIKVGNAPASQTVVGPVNVVSNSQGVIYSIPSNPGSTYQWSVPPGATIVEQTLNSIKIDFSTNGGTVAVIETNPFGNATSNLTVNVGDAPSTTSITGPDFVATGSSAVTYSVSSTPGSTYEWVVSGGATIVGAGNSNSINVDFGNIPENVSISLRETNVFGEKTITKSVTSGPAPSISSISGPVSVEIGQTYTYSIPANSNPNTTYNWTVPNGAQIVSGAGSNSITVSYPSGTQSGEIKLTEANEFGTSNASSQVTVNSTTGINSANSSILKYTAYPNPFIDELSMVINSPNTEKVTVKVIDMKGVLFYESDNYYTNEKFLLGQDLPQGLYIVQTICNGNVIYVKVEKTR